MRYGKLLMPPMYNSDMNRDRVDVAFGRTPDTEDDKKLPDTYLDRVRRMLDAQLKAKADAKADAKAN